METKQYLEPQFEIVGRDDLNRVFFAASGGSSSAGVTGGINSMTVDATTTW